ncbi:ABC transporter permease [Agrobacterium larrymoorei]|uniref:ABC transporter permease n=1 Tax=Agrobacterium larrymoorei TaxID=160699 RepID=A0A4D7E4U9_9HYPH|nr:ABC transporter permease [Agrobacterium larrymoorei]QCJ01173.1 ABC transporter permease [Agrobacterium larrymoorei]QYA10183.1 ABC transporter permease [Agrobacterium larrymoorei]
MSFFDAVGGSAAKSGNRKSKIDTIDPGLTKRARSRSLPPFFASRAFGWTVLAGLLATWQLFSWIKFNPTVSSPLLIGQTLAIELWGGDLLWPLIDTLYLLAIGFVIAAPIGIGLGFLMGRVRIIWALLEPVVEIARAKPTTAIIPVLILFFGVGDLMKILVFLLSAIFPLLMTSYAGARSLSRTLKETAQTFRLSWWATQWEVALPAAMPFILVGMRQALGTSLMMSVVVGMVAGNDGIGYYILEAQQAFNIRKLLAATVLVAAVGYIINAIFLALESHISRRRGAAPDAN